jgi:two-component system cell cycle sensor histidine kinase PleC
MEDLARARDEMEQEVRHRTKDLIVARDKAEQANLAKTRLLANVSHELRTPLNAIIGFSDMIRAGIGNASASGSTEEYAEYIKRAGEHLLSIVSDLLEITRVEAGVAELDVKEINVRSIVENVFVMVEKARKTPGPKLVADIPEKLPSLQADPLRFRQIIMNLVDNASKFSPVDSEITVSGATNGRGGISIKIIDRGIGINKEDLPRILEPFAQVQDVMSRAHTGIGLGLPLAKSLTEIMDGTLTIDSVPGEGTTVTLTFPPSRVGGA